jgi:hypothetical protein
MAIQLGKRCPKLLKMVNNKPHATDQNYEPTVKKEMTEAEVNQSPRSSISDGNFSSNNNKPHATDQDHEPTVKKEMTEAEVNQSPRSSISDGNFSSNKGEMPPPKFHGCVADTPISPLKFGDSGVPFDTWDTCSQRKRKRNKNTYSAIKNDAPLRTAERKTTSGSDNIHGSDHRQGNRRKTSPSLSTQGTSVETCLCWLFAK